MIWLAWRHGRLENVLIAVILAAFMTLLLLTGLHVASVFTDGGARACLAAHAPGALCDRTVADFSRQFGSLQGLTGWLNLLPGILGALLAAPFVLDLEQGTYRLAWTQGITRRRAVMTRIACIVVGCVVVGATVSLVFTWWRGPFDEIDGRLDRNVFGLEGIVPAAYALFAAALVLAIGAVTRRAAVAIGAAFALYIATRLWVQGFLRDGFQAPSHVVWSPTSPEPASLRHGWTLDVAFGDRLGHPLHDVVGAVGPCLNKVGGGDPSACLAARGLYNVASYFPASSFWTIQAIEAALFAGLALALAGAAAAVVLRRIG